MILDRELRYAAANPAYEAAVSKGEDELVGRNILEAFPNEGEAGRRLLASLNRVLSTGKPDTLAYIHYAIPRPEHLGGGTEDRYWSAVHSPLFDADGEVIFILQNTADITEMVRLREAAAVPFRMFPGEFELVQRAREAEAAVDRSDRDGETDFRRLFEEAPGMVAVLQGPEHVFTFANDMYRRFVGTRDLVGLKVRAALPELEGQGFFEMLDAVYMTGMPTGGRSVRVMMAHDEGEAPSESFLDFSYRPIRNGRGEVSGVFVQATDQTDNVRATDRQRLLVDELNHRVKNTLSSVQSIARQSFRGDYDSTVAQATFDARVQALSRAHDVLSDRHWESAELRPVLLQELAIYDRARVALTGPPVRLRPKAVIALAMVFHELASNAAKYGALSLESGELKVSWTLVGERGDERLSLTWREAGAKVPDAVVPGFGLKMLRRIITGELDGSLDLAFEPSGLICRLDVPLTEIEDIAGG